MMISSTDESEIKKFEEILKSKFDTTSEYDVYSHLGISMTRTKHGIKLSQPKLIQEIIEQYPTDPSSYPSKRTKRSFDRSQPLQDRILYLQLLGKLMYLSTSRPDIITALSYAATLNIAPTVNDYNELLEIVGYLKETRNRGLTLSTPSTNDNQLRLICYVIAAYMSHDDASSHTGYTISLGSEPYPMSFYHSKSKKQKLVATSSTHAEIRALYELTTTIIYLTNMLEELGRPLSEPAIVYEDNQPAIDLVTTPFSKIGKSKHFLMTTNFIKEQVTNGLMRIQHVRTEENIANVLTKIINGKEFYESFKRIMGDADQQK